MSNSVDTKVSLSPKQVSTASYDVVVVGAGPYGLAVASHLLDCDLNIAVFGVPLQLWREHMPKGMLLRSFWWATSISDPHKHYNLESYFREIDQLATDPLPAETIIEYGKWFQQHAVPDVDETYVKTIECKDKRFVVTLADDRVIESRAVVMAPGLHYYIYRPAEYRHLSAELVSHTSDHRTFEQFADKTVAIIGGGQSALETAALMYESGSHVHLISRRSLVWIKHAPAFSEHRSLLERLLNPKAGIAPGWFNWQLEHFPYLFQRLPRSIRDGVLHGPGSYGPMGAQWLRPRILEKVHLHESQPVQLVRESDNGVVLELSNNQTLKADHLILGTGYRVDISNLPMLHPSIVTSIQTYRNAPVLNSQFECSIPGFYFVGFSAVSSCGPLYRFVVGTTAAAQRVARSVVRQVRKKEYIL